MSRSRILQSHQDGFKPLQEALHKAQNEQEILIAKEKMAAAHCKCLAELTDIDEIYAQARECIRLLAALLRLKYTRRSKFENLIRTVIDTIYSLNDTSDNKKKALNNLLPHISNIPYKTSMGYMIYKEVYLDFNRGVGLQSSHFWGDSKSLLESIMAGKIDTAIGYARDDISLTEDCNILKKDIELHFKIASSVIQRSQADVELEEALKTDEYLDMEKMWMIADRYKHAEVVLKGCDVEQEAHVNSRLGHMFDKVFLNEEKAHEYYRHSIDLALTMLPRNLSTHKWYQEAATFVAKMQQKAAQKADQQNSADREPFLKQLEPELKAIQNNNTSWKRFAEFVYKTHPPKSPSAIKPTLEDNPTKVACFKMLSHYHPDKQDQTKNKWYYLCEEITKMVNVHYATISTCE